MTSKCWFLLWNKRYFIHSFSDSHYLIRTCFSYPAALFSPFENGVPKCLKNAEIYHRITAQKFQKFTVSLIYYFGDIKGWKMILYNPGQVMACFFLNMRELLQWSMAGTASSLIFTDHLAQDFFSRE